MSPLHRGAANDLSLSSTHLNPPAEHSELDPKDRQTGSDLTARLVWQLVAPDADFSDRAAAVAGTLVVDTETVRVVAAMRERGLRAVLLRGAAYVELLGYRPGERTYMDSDLLIKPSRFPEAEEVLRGLGYRESTIEAVFGERRPSHAHTWLSDRGTIDLHRTLVGVSAAPEEVWQVLSEHTRTIQLLAREVEVLDASANLVVLGLHALQHAGDDQAASDLARAVALIPTTVWSQAAELSRSLGAARSFGAGLRTTPEGAALAEELLLEDRRGAASVNRGSNSFHLAQGALWVARQRGLSAKLSFLRSKLVPTSARMRSRSRLARLGPGGLALAHLGRWVVLTAHLPSAILALRKLRHARPEKNGP